MDKERNRASRRTFRALYRAPSVLSRIVRNTEEQNGTLGDASRRRGQLREGTLRHAAEDGLPERRQTDNDLYVEEEVCLIRRSWVLGDNDQGGER